MNRTRSNRLRVWIAAVGISVALGYVGARAIYFRSEPPESEIEAYRVQREQNRRTEWDAFLRQHGLKSVADSLDRFLQAQVVASKRASQILARIRKRSEFLSWLLAIHGLTPQAILDAEMRGLDVVAALVAPARLTDRAVTSELVVLGEVTKVYDSAESRDGYHTSIDVRVLETLRGKAPSRVLTIRQESGPLGVGISSDLRPSPGDRYIFFLSNSLYRFYVLYPDDLDPTDAESVFSEAGVNSRFIRVYTELKVEDGEVVTKNLETQSLEVTLNEIRSIERALSSDN